MRSVIYGAPEVSVDELRALAQYSQPLTAACPQVQWLWDWLRRSNNEVRRSFLRFTTGMSQLSPGGLDGLRIRIEITPSTAGDLIPRPQPPSFSSSGLQMPTYRDAAELEEWIGAAVARHALDMA